MIIMETMVEYNSKEHQYRITSNFLNIVNSRCNQYDFYQNGFLLEDLNQNQKKSVINEILIVKEQNLNQNYFYLFADEDCNDIYKVVIICNKKKWVLSFWKIMSLFITFKNTSKYAKIFIIILDFYVKELKKEHPEYFETDCDINLFCQYYLKHWQNLIKIEFFKSL